MTRHSVIQNISLLTSITCLSLPYILAGDWSILLFLLAMVVFWTFMRKRSVFWSASIVLLSSVLLAVAGMLANLSTPLIVIACTAALAWWDLANFGESITIGQPQETRASLEKHHLYSLALAVFSGLILTVVSSRLDLRIPFIGAVLLALFTIGCFTYAVRSLAKKNL